MNFQVRQLTEEEVRDYESQMVELTPIQPEYRSGWEVLHNYFSKAELTEDRKYRSNFFRWYTEMSWKLINDLDPEVVISMFERQVPTAMLLDIDVWSKLMFYMQLKPFDESTLAPFYFDVQQSFLQSLSHVGVWKGQDITIKDLIEDVKRINLPSLSSLESAEINAKISGVLFTKEISDNPNFSTKPTLVTDNFIGLINFLLGVEAQNFWGVLVAFERSLLSNGIETDVEKSAEALRPSPEKTEVKTTETNKLQINFSDIKNMMENKFDKGTDGQFQDPAVVLTMLNDLAVRYKDERISELYVFNEKTNSFEWNNTLLTS